MMSQRFAMREMVCLFFALSAPEDAYQQIGERGEQPIKQLLLEVLEVTDQQCCSFLFRKAQQ
jgi:hypothetical protein